MARKEISYSLEVVDLEERIRVDAYIAANVENLSRTQVGAKDTVIFVNKKKAKNSTKVYNGQKIDITVYQDIFEGLKGEDMPLDVLYKDCDIVVVNKEQGVVVHPGAGNYEHTLVNAIIHEIGPSYQKAFETELDEEVDEEVEDVYAIDSKRPGIVHRLDKDTSGTMVIALNKPSYYELVEQFKQRTTRKAYIGIVKGHFTKRRGKIITNIVRDPKDRKRFITCDEGVGKYAETSYVVLKQYIGYALVRINIHTGRTHQIRVHFSFLGHPIVGDPIYSKDDKQYPNATLMLHAIRLEIAHPLTGERMKFNSPMPIRFKNLLRSFKPYQMEKGLVSKYYENAEKITRHQK